MLTPYDKEVLIERIDEVCNTGVFAHFDCPEFEIHNTPVDGIKIRLKPGGFDLEPDKTETSGVGWPD